MNVRGSALAPNTIAWPKRTGCSPGECALLLRVQFHHAPIVIGIAERGENRSSDSKIRVIHVRGLDSSGKPQRHFSEFICGHDLVCDQTVR